MKKVLIGLICLTFATISFAGNVSDVLGNEHDRIWLEMRDNWHNLAVGGTLTNTLTVSKGITVTAGGLTVTAGTLAGDAGVTSMGRAVVTSMGTTKKVADATIAAYSALATTITNTFAASYTGTPTGFVITDAYTGVCTNVVTWASNNVTIVMGATGITYSVFSIGPKSN
jgi:hypothetical protein